MNGVWERQISTARNVLSVPLDRCSSQLNVESLQTLETKVETVVISRPSLAIKNLTSPDALEPLTPNQLITGKSRVVLPPPLWLSEIISQKRDKKNVFKKQQATK